MNIWNKVFLVLIFLTGTFYALLISNRFALEKEWGTKLAAQEKELADNLDASERLRTDIYRSSESWGEMGLMARHHRLVSLLRGRVWTNCHAPRIPQRIQNVAKLGFCFAPTDTPQFVADIPLAQNTRVYLFDSGTPYADPSANNPAGGAAPPDTNGSVPQYLGAFQVENINDAGNEINLVSVGTVSDEDFARLEESAQLNNRWIVCGDRLPVDSPDDIAAWFSSEDAALAKILPESMQSHFAETCLSPEEMLAAEPVANKRFPVDYETLVASRFTTRDMLNLAIFTEQATLADLDSVIRDQLATLGVETVPVEILAQIGPTENDVQEFVAAYAATKAACRRESLMAGKERLTAVVATRVRQRDLVKERLDSVASTVAGLQSRIDVLIVQNADLATRIAQVQFQAVEQILQQSENLAAADSGVERTGI